MFLTNKEIYNAYEQMTLAYNDNSKYFPAKINFIIQKNKKALSELAKTIEESKQNIAKQHGTQDSTDVEVYHIPPELINQVNKELQDLMDVGYEVPIIKISLEELKNLEFTANQMEAIMFMIDESQV